MGNRLQNELSPYLRQHSKNPVDWFPWGDEALARARAEQRPILLSIGYSACHWCHVMERESFDDPEIAALMNDSFINIKVDREERPDLDKIYQAAFQVITRRAGGWPLTVFLTPDLEPFYAGTYFPPEDRHGLPGFATVLRSVAQAYSEGRGEIESVGKQVIEVLRSLEESHASGAVDRDIAVRAARKLAVRFDKRHGGFGDAPKFPSTMSLELLLRAHRRTGEDEWLSMVVQSVDAMVDGGIHDQLGGGFHRYSTDARWRVPHFEKMLYDNALIGRMLVDLWRLTGNARYREVCSRILDYVEREMTSPDGGFYATQDADSDGREGAFFVWTPDQLAATLASEDVDLVKLYYGVDDAGNFEDGATVLHVTRSMSLLAQQLGLQESEAASRLERSRERLLAARKRRNKPFRDEKIITAWNAMMTSTFAEAGAAFGEPSRLARAKNALSFLRDAMWEGGRLFRLAKDGARQGRGFLVDYACAAEAAIDLYEATFDDDWLEWGRAVVDAALDKFWEGSSGSLFFSEESDDLVLRTEDNLDNEVPSGSSAIIRALLRLAEIVPGDRYEAVAVQAMERRAGSAMDSPAAYAHLIGSIDRYAHGACHIVLVDDGCEETPLEQLADTARSAFVLDRALQRVRSGSRSVESLLGEIPQQAGAYVCVDRTCSLPAREPGELRGLLTQW